MLRKSLIAAAALAALAPAAVAADGSLTVVRDAYGNCQVARATTADPEERVGGHYNSYSEAELAARINPECDGSF